MQNKFTIGLDYGTDLVRALIVNTQTGENVGTAEKCGQIWFFVNFGESCIFSLVLEHETIAIFAI